MISLPLPDELLRKVYSYIHPVFDYTEFVNALSHHAEEEEAFTLILDRRNNIDNIDDILYKILAKFGEMPPNK